MVLGMFTFMRILTKFGVAFSLYLYMKSGDMVQMIQKHLYVV